MSQQQRQLSTYDKTDEDVLLYRCPYCTVTDEHEWLIRIHIHRSDDNPHNHHDGFMPEDTLEVIDASGDVLERVNGNPRERFETLQSLELEDMPDELSKTEKIIVHTAVQNLTEKYSKIQERVNDRLLDEGLPSVEYNKVYRTAIDELKVARKSKNKNMSQQQSQKSYEDLTDKQRAVINEFIRNPDIPKTQMAENANIELDQSYPQQVIDKYGYIAEGMTEADIIPVGEEDEAAESTESQSTDQTQADSSSKKSYEDLTELQRDVVDQIVENPQKSDKQIAEDLDCDNSYPKKVRDKFSYLIDELQEGQSDSENRVTLTIAGEETEVPAELAQDYHNLTQAQQDIIDVLVEEDDPLNPEKDRDEIGQIAGAHGTYVTEIQSKHGDLAVKLKHPDVDLSGVDLSEINLSEVDLDEADLSEFESDVEDKSTDSEPESTDVEDSDVSEESETEAEEIEEEEVAEESEEPAFSERFRDAVEAGDVSSLTVREILDNINKVDNIELLEKALEADSRKTSSGAFEDRIDDLTEDDEESEAETVVADSSGDDSTEVGWDDGEDDTASETTDSSVQETEEPAVESQPAQTPVAEGTVPVSHLEEMQTRADMLIRTAESELEDSDQKAPAARAKSVAEEFQRMIDDAIEDADSQVSSSAD